MSKFIFTHDAIEDLSEIWLYTVHEWSEEQADKYYNLIIQTCSELAKNPMLGRKYDAIEPGIKGYLTGEHIIFYAVISKNEIEVVIILHGRMDIKNKV